MRELGIEGIVSKRALSVADKWHTKYPYLLDNDNVEIERANQVWASDTTYIRVRKGLMYLAAIIDVYSRKILSHRLSDTMDMELCRSILREAIFKYGLPEIFNSDQGS